MGAVVPEDTVILQDVAVCGVELDGQDVVLGLYGGRGNACASVRLTFPEVTERVTRAAELRAWERAGTVVTMLAYGGIVSLVADRDLLERAARSPGPPFPGF